MFSRYDAEHWSQHASPALETQQCFISDASYMFTQKQVQLCYSQINMRRLQPLLTTVHPPRKPVCGVGWGGILSSIWNQKQIYYVSLLNLRTFFPFENSFEFESDRFLFQMLLNPETTVLLWTTTFKRVYFIASHIPTTVSRQQKWLVYFRLYIAL